MKTLTPGAAFSKSTSAAFNNPVEKRQKQFQQPGEGPGPCCRRVRGAAQHIPRHHRPGSLSTCRWTSTVLRHRQRGVQVHLPPAGPEGPGTRTTPRVGQTHAGRCRDVVRHPNQPRPTAAEATDEDEKEAHAFYHHTHPLAMGDRPLEGASSPDFSC